MKKTFRLLITVPALAIFASCTRPANPTSTRLSAGTYKLFDYYALDSASRIDHLYDSLSPVTQNAMILFSPDGGYKQLFGCDSCRPVPNFHRTGVWAIGSTGQFLTIDERRLEVAYSDASILILRAKVNDSEKAATLIEAFTKL